MDLHSEKELIDLLINSNDFKELIAIYSANITQLREYTIFAFDNQMTEAINTKPPLDFTKKVKAASIVSIYKSSFCMLNEEIYYKMTRGVKADFEYKYCFDLDLNMMNVLVDYHNCIDRSTIATSLLTDLELLENDFTCIPYLIENAKKMGDTILERHVIETLLIFNKFKHSTLSSFSPDYPNTEQDFQDTKNAIDMMKKDTTTVSELIFKLQKYIYALLLKTTIISFCNKGEITQKIVELMEFINDDLGIFLERENVICYWFLKNRNDNRISKFFKAIQPNAKNLLNTLKGMSWDLFHLRFNIEMGMASDLREGMICLHYLITQDNGLADVTNAHPIKYMIYKKGDITPKTVYVKPIYEVITEMDILQNLQDNARNRNATYENKNIDEITKKLEKELISHRKTT